MRRAFMASLIAVCFAAPLLAAKPDPLPATDPQVYNRDLTRNAEATQAMADCIVKGRPREAREAVIASYSIAQIRDKTPGLVRPGCMNAAVPGMGYLKGVLYAGDLYLYALAEAVLRLDRTLDVTFDFSKAPPLTHRAPFVDEAKLKGREIATVIERERAREETQYFLSRYGECVVRNGTADAAAVLKSMPGSPEERSAFAALQPVLGKCMKGAEQVRLGKPALRGTLALNFYRLAAVSGNARVALGKN